MSSYDALAPWYDQLTGDVPYSEIADFYERAFRADGGEFRLLLDLCCGTGSMTWELAARGYEMIAADRSPDMLMQAQNKRRDCAVPPLFLCQSAEELDLYGTVDAAVCCLDGFNYIPLDALRISLSVRTACCSLISARRIFCGVWTGRSLSMKRMTCSASGGPTLTRRRAR